MKELSVIFGKLLKLVILVAQVIFGIFYIGLVLSCKKR